MANLNHAETVMVNGPVMLSIYRVVITGDTWLRIIVAKMVEEPVVHCKLNKWIELGTTKKVS